MRSMYKRESGSRNSSCNINGNVESFRKMRCGAHINSSSYYGTMAASTSYSGFARTNGVVGSTSRNVVSTEHEESHRCVVSAVIHRQTYSLSASRFCPARTTRVNCLVNSSGGGSSNNNGGHAHGISGLKSSNSKRLSVVESLSAAASQTTATTDMKVVSNERDDDGGVLSIPPPMFAGEGEFASSISTAVDDRKGAYVVSKENDSTTLIDRKAVDEESEVRAREVELQSILSPVREDFTIMRENLLNIVGSRHPMLIAAAEEIFGAGGKRIRPMLSLLVARATLPWKNTESGSPAEAVDFPLPDLTEKHRRLAEILEMIHTASLVHDDVLDECELRRGKPTTVAAYGTRFAVLAGDFLFAQSSWFLANLDNLEVIKLISQVIADFADGEIAQAQKLFDTNFTMEDYSEKNFYKTASLIAAGCRGAAVFSDCDEDVKKAMYDYGKHLGLAFQIVDDILDFTTPEEVLGKPAGQDLATGNLTAPTLFALQITSQQQGNSGNRLKQLIESGFKEQNELDEALSIIESCGAYESARKLARHEGDVALKQLDCLPESESKESLKNMVEYVLRRIY